MVAKTMERDARICEDRYGCHCLLFANCNGLEFDQISEIFARFGAYRSIRRAGSECGIHFVTYETYEEARNAVDNLEDHPDIRLKVYREKNQINSNERRNRVNDDYHNNNDNGNRPSRRQQDSRWPNARYDVGQHFERHRPSRRQQDSRCRPSARYDVGQRLERHRRTDARTLESYHTREECDEHKEDRFVNYLLASSACNGASSGESARKVERDEDQMSTSLLNSSQYSNDDRPSGSVDTEDEQQSKDSLEDEEEQVAASVETGEDDQMPHEESTVENASEIVVGNVDPKFDEAYLLHLFAKFEPIAISALVPLPRGDTRYCHLYFKSPEVAETVERSCDKLTLAGRPIVVQRPLLLIATCLEGLVM